MIDKDSIINRFFSDLNEETWFDCHHFHSDWESEGNKDWSKREKHLNELIAFYKILRKKLTKLPKDFQLFIIIDENDSGQDALYVHTKNPNCDNFPLKITPSRNREIFDVSFGKFIENSKMQLVIEDTNEGRQFYLFKQNVGIPLN